jgi:NADH:ubiquinone oxidoreductase subunit 5 (subunit L)/multisubunit Na+/H+ antiporter MnhA subunit
VQGVGRRIPYTTLEIIVSFTGLGVFPSTSGFMSKFKLLNSTLGAGLPALAALGVLNSVLSIVYYLRIIMTLISGNVQENVKAKEAPFLIVGVTSGSGSPVSVGEDNTIADAIEAMALSGHDHLLVCWEEVELGQVTDHGLINALQRDVF